ncbi:MAG: gas vesicle protein GvpG [Chloroherpetonaceae bacterium]|nr:gas vesicle protein GvpG [Chloroherpetonaceae bacterium]MDW8437327.1 gas vesicle protein GvpG [Chloroherpetonaceae bacterium]
MFIIDDILLAPINALVAIAKAIDEQVQRETTDVRRIKEKLMELRLKFEFDEISEEEYDAREKELLEQLERAQSAQRE